MLAAGVPCLATTHLLYRLERFASVKKNLFASFFMIQALSCGLCINPLQNKNFYSSLETMQFKQSWNKQVLQQQ
jgi:hypothetical protein